MVAESLSNITKVNEEKIKIKLEKIAEEKTGVIENEEGYSEETNQSRTESSE